MTQHPTGAEGFFYRVNNGEFGEEFDFSPQTEREKADEIPDCDSGAVPYDDMFSNESNFGTQQNYL